MKLHNTPAESRREPDDFDSEAIGIERPGLRPSTPGERPHNEPFRDILTRNLARRSFLKGAAAVPVLLAGGSLLGSTTTEAAVDRLSFAPIGPTTTDDVVVPSGY